MEREEAVKMFLEQLKLKPGVLEDFEFRQVKGGWVATVKNDFKHWNEIPLGMTAFSISEKTRKVRSYGVSMRREGSDTSKLAEADLEKGL